MNGAAQREARPGFWKRLAAAWIDGFIIYVSAAFVITLGGTMGVRMVLEPLFVVVGVVYGTMLLARCGQTIGKMLVGIAVQSKTDDRLSLRHVLLREVLGKWGIAVTLPVALGRGMVGQAWVSTVYDVLVLLPVLLLQLLHYRIAKRAWYDGMAGTAVVRTSGARGRVKPAFAALMVAGVLGLGTKAATLAARGRLPCRLAFFQSARSMPAGEAFLRREHAAPVDYIMDLFDRYDVVVIGERLHPEGSQWDFIYELVRDPRFIDRVGRVFTEYGQAGMQAYLDRFMATDSLSPEEVRRRVVHIMRNWPVWPVWNNTNVYTFLTRLYGLNQSLPRGQRIRLHFTDVATDWERMRTHEEYSAYWRSLENRDEQMARGVIEEMNRIAESTGRSPKCLVVMNYRHAFDLTGRAPEAVRMNTCEFLKDAFGDRAANVLLNTRMLLFVRGRPILVGTTWERAFEDTGHRTVGFDFEGSPFGQDPFDLFPFRQEVNERLQYRDVFTGFVYAHRLEDQYIQHGVPGYFDGFEQETLRRAGLVGEDYRRWVQGLIDAEKNGRVMMVKEPLPELTLETRVDLSLFGVAGIAVLIGAGVFTFSLGTASPPA